MADEQTDQQEPPTGQGLQQSSNVVPLEEAVSNVDLLQDIPTPDPQPLIEAKTIALTYHANFDTNFGDRTAFITGIARYMEEATVHSEMNKILKEGEEHAVMLYTWRSCARAVPSIKSNLQENRREIKETFVEIMKPEIAKLTAFMHFQERAINEFCEDFRRLCHIEKRNDFVSESYLLTLGRLMNMFAVLDALKDSKASVRNDNSAYNRDANFLRSNIDVNAVQESGKMTLFLATNQAITLNLKTTLLKIEGYEEMIADVVNLCVRLFNKGQYVLPTEKHLLVKVMAIGLFLMDNENNSIYKMDQKNRISLSKIDKIFKQLEVVPLYGDLQISVLSFVKRCANYETHQSFWKSENISASGAQFNLLQQQDDLRDKHTKYVAQLVKYSKIHPQGKVTEEQNQKVKEKSDEECRAIYDLAREGLQLLSNLTALVTEMFSWKLLHPSTSHKKEVEEAEEYEKATRFNYNKQEKFALIEIIAMIKSLQALMSKLEPFFKDAIHRTIYAEIQDFVQLTLREPMRAAVKRTKKKKGHLILTIIRGVRESCCDWLKGNAPTDDPVLKGDKDPKGGYTPEAVPRRAVSPSTTQLYMVRTMLESLVADKGGSGKKTMRHELQGLCPVEPFEEFLRRSFFYLHMVNLPDTIRKCGDLSQLWYREFYLEMTMGKHIQFPIEMSIPWILTDEILTAKEPGLMEYVFFPLDLYNDSAQYALSVFKKQFLYDEIEAEVNLCFDQLVYKLAEMIFAYYKELAGSMLLDKRFRKDCKKHHIDIPCQPANRYETILRQRHVQILGRSVDMSKLLSQRIVQSITTSLQLAIARFEGHGINEGLIELDCLFQINQLAHSMLSAYIVLPSFQSLVSEADSNVGGPCGTIALNLALDLSSEVLPKYCYNGTTQRFVRTKLIFIEDTAKDKPATAQPAYYFGSKALNTVYGQLAGLYQGYVGTEHIRIMVRLLGYQQLHVVIEELLKIVKGWIQSMCVPYVKVLLQEAMPAKCKLPKTEYGTQGLVVYYYTHVQDVVQYGDLRTHCLCSFQSVGNAIIFFHLLDQILNVEEAFDLFQASPFLRILPKPYCAKGEKQETKLKQMEQNYAALHISELMQRLGTKEQLLHVQESELLLRERGACGNIIFKEILLRIQSFLDDPVWKGEKEPENGVMHIDESNVEFQRLWSAIMIVCCLPFNENNISVEESYGDGLNWAGCTIMTLLAQARKFELLDFCSHILRVHDVDGKTANINGINVKRYVDRISNYQILNQQIFNVLNKTLQTGEQVEKSPDSVALYKPPIHQSMVTGGLVHGD
ncbi:cytoplasmic FMR1-interacting protein 1-like isoform X1 [Diadema antillarum]|uniref:cytoplasmic FMR1-interacting protein 1-like isoform X1 n=1 Tax=Diadema antillarum TaxID=105358 RepID=UPI003A88A00A